MKRPPHTLFSEEERAKNKTTRELRAELKKFEISLIEQEKLRESNPLFKNMSLTLWTGHIAFLKRVLAERVGK